MRTLTFDAHTGREFVKVFPASDSSDRQRIAQRQIRQVAIVVTGSTSGFQLLDRDAWGVAASSERAFHVNFRSDQTQTGFFHNPAEFDVAFRARIGEAVATGMQKEKNRRAVALLRSWLAADDAGANEQRETFEFLSEAVDSDRPSERKLFH